LEWQVVVRNLGAGGIVSVPDRVARKAATLEGAGDVATAEGAAAGGVWATHGAQRTRARSGRRTVFMAHLLVVRPA
jgi:hypothetical protein